MDKPSCERCVYAAKEDGALFCRRYPPVAVVVPQQQTIVRDNRVTLTPAGIFPPVSPKAWCGEFSDFVAELHKKI